MRRQTALVELMDVVYYSGLFLNQFISMGFLMGIDICMGSDVVDYDKVESVCIDIMNLMSNEDLTEEECLATFATLVTSCMIECGFTKEFCMANIERGYDECIKKQNYVEF